MLIHLKSEHISDWSSSVCRNIQPLSILLMPIHGNITKEGVTIRLRYDKSLLIIITQKLRCVLNIRRINCTAYKIRFLRTNVAIGWWPSSLAFGSLSQYWFKCDITLVPTDKQHNNIGLIIRLQSSDVTKMNSYRPTEAIILSITIMYATFASFIWRRF